MGGKYQNRPAKGNKKDKLKLTISISKSKPSAFSLNT
jgi:hypothetical protein